jgi:hypothetical protein
MPIGHLLLRATGRCWLSVHVGSRDGRCSTKAPSVRALSCATPSLLAGRSFGCGWETPRSLPFSERESARHAPQPAPEPACHQRPSPAPIASQHRATVEDRQALASHARPPQRPRPPERPLRLSLPARVVAMEASEDSANVLATGDDFQGAIEPGTPAARMGPAVCGGGVVPRAGRDESG